MGVKQKYFLTEPVPGGNAWWEIHAHVQKLPNDEEQENFVVASFSIHLPNAKREACALLKRLNSSK